MTPQDSNTDIRALSNLLDSVGIAPEDLISSLQVIAEAKKITVENAKEEAATKNKNKIYGDKEYLYPNEKVFIYRDNRTKTRNYYVEWYDYKNRKKIVQGLKTTHRETAWTKADEIWKNHYGRSILGIKAKSLTTKELINKYENERRKEISNIPHTGITPDSFDAMVNRLKHWANYIEALGFKNTPIENIDPDVGVSFGKWIKAQEVTTGRKKGNKQRSNGTINECIGTTKKMYKDIALDLKYISPNNMPRFKRLKVQRDKAPKRDILMREEFQQISKWMKEKYPFQKGISHKEHLKRRVYNLTFTIQMLSGMRPKEMITTRWSDISSVSTDKKGYGRDVIIHIDGERSKTGITRENVAPVSRQLESIKRWYKELGHEVDPNSDEYVFLVMTNNGMANNKHISAKSMNDRLKKIQKDAEAEGSVDLKNRELTNYSARHYYITDQLLNNPSLNIAVLTKNVGTSTTYIDETYSHVVPLMKSDEITHNLGKHKDNIFENIKRRVGSAG